MRFKEFLIERVGGGGDESGKFEIVKTSLPMAIQLMNSIYHQDHTVSPKNIFKNFAKNYQFAQRLAGIGETKRVDMPVIRRANALALQNRLRRGAIDLKAPFSKNTDQSNPFPNGLSGPEAQKFLTNGFRDGSLSDDRVNVEKKLKAAGSLKPIQEQIYLDKALTFGLNMQPSEFKSMVANSFMITSSDNFILDGHHRWLFAILLDPSIKMASIEIDLPIKTLLKLLTAYSDAIGNQRNK